MPVTDTREPGVYVTIEDASYVASAIEVGRTVFIVGLCTKGPHNRVVTVASQEEFQYIFGKPDFHVTTQSHYNMDKALQYTGKGLYIRVMPEDSTIANLSIIENSSPNALVGTANTEFTFTQLPSTVTKPVSKNYIGQQAAYTAALNAYNLAYKESCLVIVSDSNAFKSISVGDWIFSNDGVDSYVNARQVIAKLSSTTDLASYPTGTAGLLQLDGSYSGTFTSGTTKTSSAIKYSPFVTTSYTMLQDEDPLKINALSKSLEASQQGMDTAPTDSLYWFYAIGAGTYYNKLKIKGVRNVDLEKMYTYDKNITDLDGNIIHKAGDVKYKYLFMNIGVYEEASDGRDKLLEGPWVVSLTRKTPEGMIIRDLSTGNPLYIQEIINDRSDLIRCVAGTASQNLSLPDSETNNPISELNRQLVTLMLSASKPVGTTNYVPSGNSIQLGNGLDGTTDGQPLYTAAGYLNQGDEIWGRCAQAFNGTLTSYDGTIEQLREAIYPWYTPDYIVTGGFPTYVQEYGRDLADYRQDVFHLADTGFKTSYEDDLTARLEEVDWNNWTSMLYVQYREIDDVYTGQKLWINPCYHAIERHLVVDAEYFIAEPVAGIEKGAISDSINLAYKCNHTERGDLQDSELNFVIVEPDGKYLLTQLTTWKRLSILKRAHAAKFVCYCRKMIPPLLKDILQRKGTTYWIDQAQQRVDYFLSKFSRTASVERYQILDSYSVKVEFDDVSSELNVYINMKPLRVIERINVFITVE